MYATADQSARLQRTFVRMWWPRYVPPHEFCTKLLEQLVLDQPDSTVDWGKQSMQQFLCPDPPIKAKQSEEAWQAMGRLRLPLWSRDIVLKGRGGGGCRCMDPRDLTCPDSAPLPHRSPCCSSVAPSPTPPPPPWEGG